MQVNQPGKLFSLEKLSVKKLTSFKKEKLILRIFHRVLINKLSELNLSSWQQSVTTETFRRVGKTSKTHSFKQFSNFRLNIWCSTLFSWMTKLSKQSQVFLKSFQHNYERFVHVSLLTPRLAPWPESVQRNEDIKKIKGRHNAFSFNKTLEG